MNRFLFIIILFFCLTKASTQTVSPPTWGRITIDSNSQKLKLFWEPSPDSDIIGYFLCQGEPCENFDTIWNVAQTSYECATCDPEKEYRFRIRAINSNSEESPLTDYQNNMVVKIFSEKCSPKIRLEWNEYINMKGGLGGYRIFMRENNGSYQNIGVTNNTFFEYKVSEMAQTGSFYIEAFNNSESITALSNIIHQTFESNLKNYLYIESASVSESNLSIELTILIDNSLINEKHDLYKSINSSSPAFYKEISPAGQSSLSILDDQVNGSANVYSYYLQSKDGCQSNRTTAIKTDIQFTDNYIVYLNWNAYNGWDVKSYDIQRKFGNAQWYRVGTVNSSELNFSEDISIYKDYPERIFYRVIANNPSSVKAYSSVVEVLKKGTIEVPNVFTPRGVESSPNTQFKPKLSSVLNEGYSFSVYNRNGEMIFRTTNPNEGWDGKYRGRFCSSGGYVYYIQCVFSDRTTDTKSGSFLLLE